MRVRRLSIRHIKAIPTLDITFDERITLLHGANGIGKSTILDCLAVLGHVATMYRVVMDHDGVKIQPPALHAALRSHPELTPGVAAQLDSIEAALRPRHKAIRDTLAPMRSVDEWFDDSYRTTPRIRYECETDLTGVTSDFTVVVAFTSDPELTVSHVLNRSRCDDLDMAEHLAVLYDGRNPAIAPFLSHQAATSTSIVTDDAGKVIAAFPPRPTVAIDGNRVVAINTDLADLGKRDQIRESVKDLNLHLGQEIERLNLPFDRPLGPDQHRFRFFDEFRGILQRVITDPAAGRRSAAAEPFLELTRCDLVKGQPVIELKRGGEGRGRSTDFMSSGENECFFVFLTLLGIDIRKSIVILDEPELHIAEYSRPAFFAELYALTRDRGCQVVIATHSLFALTDNEPTQFLVVGRKEEPGGTYRYTCGPNPEYSLALFKAYWRTGALFLGTARSARPFRALASAAYTSMDRLGKERPIPVALLVSVLAAAVFALVSDLANLLHLQSGAEHIAFIRFIIFFGLLVALVSALLFWMRPRGKR
ncbi:MAG TPA: AAA family ATPase [Actinophytocola sp.]|uniref:AAA family ATPase n=1 Tax=Actinophytocola sp. TaxID=1872138 RepID=UPI002DDD3A91|nr:AAA family ATPase [Actinophytocola sp.]HEV2784353.1 AAA family ATPase [Actinophytocola sp.]